MQRLAIVLPCGEEFEATVYDNWRFQINPMTLRPGPPTGRMLANLEQIPTDLVGEPSCALKSRMVVPRRSRAVAGLVVERYLPGLRDSLDCRAAAYRSQCRLLNTCTVKSPTTL